MLEGDIVLRKDGLVPALPLAEWRDGSAKQPRLNRVHHAARFKYSAGRGFITAGILIPYAYFYRPAGADAVAAVARQVHQKRVTRKEGTRIPCGCMSHLVTVRNSSLLQISRQPYLEQ